PGEILALERSPGAIVAWPRCELLVPVFGWIAKVERTQLIERSKPWQTDVCGRSRLRLPADGNIVAPASHHDDATSRLTPPSDYSFSTWRTPCTQRPSSRRCQMVVKRFSQVALFTIVLCANLSM